MSNLSATSQSDASSGGEVTLRDLSPRYAKQRADARLRYRLVGAYGLPVVVVLGGISADAAVIERENGTPGWWHDQAGPGLGVDTRHFRVLSFDYLTRRDLGEGCPAVSTQDQAQALAGLLDALKINSLQAVIGASYGAMIGLCFAACHPERLKQLVAISGAHRAHPFAAALRGLQREIIHFGAASEDSFALARALALTTYLTPEYFARRFASVPSLEAEGFYSQALSFLVYNGRKYAKRADADVQRYLDLSQSLDLHTVAAENIYTPTTLIAANPDSIVPLVQMRELAARLAGPARLHVVESVHGHDAFLQEHVAFKPLLQEALEGEYRHVA